MNDIQKMKNDFTNYEGVYGNTMLRSTLARVQMQKFDRKYSEVELLDVWRLIVIKN